MARTYNRDSRGRFASGGGGGKSSTSKNPLGYRDDAWMSKVKPVPGATARYKKARKNPVATFGTQKSKASKSARRRAGYTR